MGSYTSNANIVLSINGKQAQKMLKQLEKEAQILRDKINQAASAGDKVGVKKLERELKNTQRTLDQLRGNANAAATVLQRLDKASPKELNRALKQLQNELNGIERGSKAWDEHMDKIRRVRAEISRVGAAMSNAKPPSAWEKMAGWFNQFAGAVMAATAAIGGFIMAGRGAVNAYADMEESLANTRKYTRMTKAEVAELNEKFKGMDTRIARDQLNLLAQEGGRLGYNTVQNVQEYVEAASIINVALCDLGEGATQTIAKLSNIFGIEKMYGVRDSMLKVGSTVNHLSQNCTAAKPFLVEFAQRMAGIGSVSKMTIPEIIAFAATLDAHGQKVEMSATALQRIIIELSKNSDEMAKRVGLNAQKLTYAFRKDTTQGVIMFLEALNKLGSHRALAALSTAFEDMGLDGARVTSVLSNLSSHMGFLKWQIQEANQAFNEGTSASGEYAIFNNTVQAQISKAREKVHEIAIELGEKLYPILKHVYTSSSVLLRVLSHITNAVIALRVPLTAIAYLVAAYGVQVLATSVKTKAAAGAQVLWNFALAVGKNSVGLFRLAVAALSNTVGYFTNGLQVSCTMQDRWRKAMDSMNFSNWIGMVLLLVGAIYKVTQAFANFGVDKFKQKLDDLRSSTESYNEEVIKEQRSLDGLMGKLIAHKKGTEEYEKLKSILISKYGKYISHLINEKNEIINLKEAYDLLTKAIRRNAMEKGILSAQAEMDKAYSKEVADKLLIFKKMLVSYGASEREAAYITEKANTAIITNTPLEQRIADRVWQISQKKPLVTVDGAKVDPLKRLMADSWFDKLWSKYFPVDIHQDGDYYWNPRDVYASIISDRTNYNEQSKQINDMLSAISPLKDIDTGYLNSNVKIIQDFLKSNPKGDGSHNVNLWGVYKGKFGKYSYRLSKKALEDKMQEYIEEISYRSATETVQNADASDYVDMKHYSTEKEARANATQERKAEAEAKRQLKTKLDAITGEKEKSYADATTQYNLGKMSYDEYLRAKYEADVKYYKDRIKLFRDAGEWENEDYKKTLEDQAAMYKKWTDLWHKLKIEDLQKDQKSEELKAQIAFNSDKNSLLYNNEFMLQNELYRIKVKYLRKMRDTYTKDSDEYRNYEAQLFQGYKEEELRLVQLYEAKKKEWIQNYDVLTARQKLNMELGILNAMMDKGTITGQEFEDASQMLIKKYSVDLLPEAAKKALSKDDPKKKKEKELARIKLLEDKGEIDAIQAKKAREAVEKAFFDEALDKAKALEGTYLTMVANVYEAFEKLFSKAGDGSEDLISKVATAAAAVVAVLGAGFEAASEYMSASNDLQLAEIEKRYEAELELAEGNSAQTTAIEKRKQAEISKIKSDAADKQFAMDLIMAVANTAINAITAYGAGLKVPGVGLTLAPIAASMAVAAGAVQIATIEKQRAAAKVQGYSSGGFTRPGAVDEPAGIVHAGEWVASQKLVRDPRARQIIDLLDYAQRNNAIASLQSNDVSRSLTTNLVWDPFSNSGHMPGVTVNVDSNNSVDYASLAETLALLTSRLNEPFVTVNTVTGDHGMLQADAKYRRLINNKNPKF